MDERYPTILYLYKINLYCWRSRFSFSMCRKSCWDQSACLPEEKYVPVQLPAHPFVCSRYPILSSTWVTSTHSESVTHNQKGVRAARRVYTPWGRRRLFSLSMGPLDYRTLNAGHPILFVISCTYITQLAKKKGKPKKKETKTKSATTYNCCETFFVESLKYHTLYVLTRKTLSTS